MKTSPRWKRSEIIGLSAATIIAIVMLFGVPALVRPSRDAAACQSNLKQLGLAMFQYVRDYDEKYPLAKNWGDALQPYHKQDINLYRCPARGDLPCGYAMHASVAQRSLADIADPKNTIMYFDSDAGAPNHTDKGTSLPASPRHPKGHSIAFNDGHAEFVEVPDFKYGYDPAQIAQSRKASRQQQDFSPRARQEFAEKMRQKERQSLLQKQRMKRPLTPAEQQWLQEDNLRRQKEIDETRKLSLVKKP